MQAGIAGRVQLVWVKGRQISDKKWQKSLTKSSNFGHFHSGVMVEKLIEFEVIIVGGGPAGLSALLWCLDMELKVILLEKEPELGGQLLQTYSQIKNYLGASAANGRDLRDSFLRQIEARESYSRNAAEVVKADLVQRVVSLAGNSKFGCKYLILATGVRRRRLGVPGEDRFRGRGILESGVQSKNDVAGKRVLIIGGGDAALENSLILGEKAASVVIAHRRDKFTARSEFVDRATRHVRITPLFNTIVTAIDGHQSVESAELRHSGTGELSRLPVDAVLIRIGVEPNTETFGGQIETDNLGYIRVDSSCKTSIPNVFAVGDVAKPFAPTISGAVGDAATAVKRIYSLLR